MSHELYWPFPKKTVAANAENVAVNRTTALVAVPHLARIPSGDFLMGAADGQPDERPVHRVRVREFFIGRFPVTNDDYAHFVRATGHPSPGVRGLPQIASDQHDRLFTEFAAPYIWHNGEPPAGHGNHPVVLVTYDDAIAYCAWLSRMLNRTVRLPTEAEWEKAARGGVESARYPWGDDFDPACCNYLADPSTKRQRGTRPAGTYPPNGYGLCDVTGNVWEWIADWYSADYYGETEPADPRGPATGSLRIVRGGSWVTEDPSMMRCAHRHGVPTDTYAYSIGFRIVCSE
jgi:formylglycine-generating enzyme required for sulfatase activity